MTQEIENKNCLTYLRSLEADSVDSIVTDPPYGLGFMGRQWDSLPPGQEVFEECLRVLKPGGHLLAFGGSRTYHRLAVAVEDAGFEIREQIQWLYGSGFPKNHDISKAIDKQAGAERELVGANPNNRPNCAGKKTRSMSGPITTQPVTAPATEPAKQWEGWGTALKPAHEPIVMARKPLEKGLTIAQNVQKWGTGGINIDGGRVGSSEKLARPFNEANNNIFGKYEKLGNPIEPTGRFPANLIHDGSDEVVGLFPVTTSGGGNKSRKGTTAGGNCYGTYGAPPDDVREIDSGSAARFFYTAKASKKDRTEHGQINNNHPTVKPTDLMQYLIRLVTPEGGTTLDPFAGSGTTAKAAYLEGFTFKGCDQDAESVEIAKERLKAVKQDHSSLASG